MSLIDRLAANFEVTILLNVDFQRKADSVLAEHHHDHPLADQAVTETGHDLRKDS